MRKELDDLSQDLMKLQQVKQDRLQSQLVGEKFRALSEKRRQAWSVLEDFINKRNALSGQLRANEVVQQLVDSVLGVAGVKAPSPDDLLSIDEQLLSIVKRLKAERERETQVRQELMELLTAREQLSSQFKWMELDGQSSLNKKQLEAAEAEANNSLTLLTFDYRKRKVVRCRFCCRPQSLTSSFKQLHRLCEEIQLSGLAHDQKERSTTLTNCFTGAGKMSLARN